jgi:hypothetical protein
MALPPTLRTTLRRLAAVGLTAAAVLAAAPGHANASTPAPRADQGTIVEPHAPGATRIAQKGSAGAFICSGHSAEYGDWANADPNTRSLPRVELRDCADVVVCHGDICSITHDAGWVMHLFGACSPTLCDWGWTAGAFRQNNGQIPGFYDQGYAKRYVVAAMSQYRPGQLWVHVATDFVDPNRADYASDDWFVRA